MKHLDLFTGMLGFSEALKRAFGDPYELVLACEIEQACQKVIARHRPGVPIHPDVKELDCHGIQADIVTFGSPCQDLSVAGRREGLDGERSGLFFEAVRILEEVRPRWFIFENVPGLLSSWCAHESPPCGDEMGMGRDGELWEVDEISDLGVVLSEFSRLGYWYSFRVLDAQYFGVAQRRERVFVVGSLGGPSACTVLFEPESVCWNPPPSREKGKGITQSLTRSLGSGGADDNRAQGGFYVPEISPAIKARDCKGPSSDGDGDGAPLIAHTLKSRGFDASEDGTGRGTPIVPVAFQSKASCTQGMNPSETCPTIDRCKSDGLAVAFTERTRSGGRNLEYQEELAYAVTNLGSGGRTHSRQIMSGIQVRRLTPLECLRLQGFPDDWLDDLGLSDSAKYRMIGNGVALPVVEWIAMQIRQATR